MQINTMTRGRWLHASPLTGKHIQNATTQASVSPLQAWDAFWEHANKAINRSFVRTTLIMLYPELSCEQNCAAFDKMGPSLFYLVRRRQQ